MFRSNKHGLLIVPRESQVPLIIKHFYEMYKRENRLKLSIRIRGFYSGISNHRIQDWINHNEEHFKRIPVFLNKDELKPITANFPMERIQVDLVNFSSFTSTTNEQTLHMRLHLWMDFLVSCFYRIW